MGPAIGDQLPFAIGIALGPIPVIAVILMLFSARPVSNCAAYLTGWVCGLAIFSTIVLVVVNPAGTTGGGRDTPIGAIVRLAIGIGLVLLAWREWRHRRRPGQKAELPRWMNSIGNIRPFQALGLGAAFSGLHIKNATLIFGAMLTLAQANLARAQTVGVVVLFIVLSSVSVLAPFVVYLMLGERAAKPLGTCKEWLEANSATVMTVVLLILGTVAIGKSLGTLIG
ncbi:MAG: GAP family protein [Chloroflexi bacterium]|nr:GAP family protein [Chloroflexota bacterium]MBV9134549.1 GAP family protein [Chloroflexota bacterium]MBV9895098.1 GAP family protein [Chloroflexota bacterium]